MMNERLKQIKPIEMSTESQDNFTEPDDPSASCKNKKCIWVKWCAAPTGNMNKSTIRDTKYLPVAKDKKDGEEHIERRTIPTGTERILVIDDEQVMVNLEEEMLSRLGYCVVSKTSSIEALCLFREDPERFDLVITDMTMPVMAGDSLAQKLLEIRSDIPIIMYTGSIHSINEIKAKGIGIREFIMKPSGMSVLAETVRRVLDKG
jgi:CheY-like chemotaxis protein